MTVLANRLLLGRHMLTARSLAVIAALYLAVFLTVRLHGVIRDPWTVLAVVLLLGTSVLIGWVMATRPGDSGTHVPGEAANGAAGKEPRQS